jgi:hypothetical protein
MGNRSNAFMVRTITVATSVGRSSPARQAQAGTAFKVLDLNFITATVPAQTLKESLMSYSLFCYSAYHIA